MKESAKRGGKVNDFRRIAKEIHIELNGDPLWICMQEQWERRGDFAETMIKQFFTKKDKVVVEDKRDAIASHE